MPTLSPMHGLMSPGLLISNSLPGEPHLEQDPPSRRVPQLSHHLHVSLPWAMFWAMPEGFYFIFIWVSLFPLRMQDERYEIHVNPGYGRSRFSRRELGDIAISMIVLAVAFTILYRNSSFMDYLDLMYGDTARWGILLAVCLMLVVFSFLLHEFGHKFVAQRYGMWSEYRMYPMGLVLTLVTSVIGFLFAAPGAVYIDGPMDRERNGKISIAGPTVNIIRMPCVQPHRNGLRHADARQPERFPCGIQPPAGPTAGRQQGLRLEQGHLDRRHRHSSPGARIPLPVDAATVLGLNAISFGTLWENTFVIDEIGSTSHLRGYNSNTDYRNSLRGYNPHTREGVTFDTFFVDEVTRLFQSTHP